MERYDYRKKWKEKARYADELADEKLRADIAEIFGCTESRVKSVFMARSVDFGCYGVPLYRGAEDMTIREFPYAYGFYEKDKEDGGKREIEASAPPLASLQKSHILPFLREGGFPDWVTGGEPGTSPRRHLEMHHGNNFMLALDFKSAFKKVPRELTVKSVGPRVMSRIDQVFPNIDEQTRQKIFNIIFDVFLLKDGYIPQGTPSGNSLYNRALEPVDREVMDYFFNNSGAVRPRFSRYVDDTMLSLWHFETFRKPWALLLCVEEILDLYLNGETDENILIQLMDNYVDQIEDTEFYIQDDVERIAFEGKIDGIRLKTLEAIEFFDSEEEKKELREVLRRFDKVIKFRSSRVSGMQRIRDDVKKIYDANGLTLNEEKTKIFTPAGPFGDERVVVGVAIDEGWELRLPNEKYERYCDFMKKCAEDPMNLPNDYKIFAKSGNKLIGFKTRMLSQTLMQILLQFRMVNRSIPEEVLQNYLLAVKKLNLNPNWDLVRWGYGNIVRV